MRSGSWWFWVGAAPVWGGLWGGVVVCGGLGGGCGGWGFSGCRFLP
ncbi:hypothetical protein [Pseudomonas syringae group genomosp. 7]